MQVKSQRHSDCSDQYSVLGDFEHPASLAEDSRRQGAEEDGENQKTGAGGGREGGKREGDSRLRRGREKDLDFVIDVTQTEPKSMSLQVIKHSSHNFTFSRTLNFLNINYNIFEPK